jgi:hypothetical protein
LRLFLLVHSTNLPIRKEKALESECRVAVEARVFQARVLWQGHAFGWSKGKKETVGKSDEDPAGG